MDFSLPPHRIEQSRNRHSRAFFDGDTIVIRLAKNLSSHQEREHVENLLRRMAQQKSRETKRSLIDPFRALLNGASSAVIPLEDGGSYTFELHPAGRTRTQETKTGWQIAVGPKLRGTALHKLLWKLLCEREEPIMAERIRELNERTLKVRVSGTRLRYATSQWGSCSPRNEIMLNPALLFTGEELLNYVVVHELAHCIHKNHSKTYWKTVERAMPNYKEARKLLRDFRIPSLREDSYAGFGKNEAETRLR